LAPVAASRGAVAGIKSRSPSAQYPHAACAPPWARDLVPTRPALVACASTPDRPRQLLHVRCRGAGASARRTCRPSAPTPHAACAPKWARDISPKSPGPSECLCAPTGPRHHSRWVGSRSRLPWGSGWHQIPKPLGAIPARGLRPAVGPGPSADMRVSMRFLHVMSALVMTDRHVLHVLLSTGSGNPAVVFRSLILGDGRCQHSSVPLVRRREASIG
jgi:hypothetical protein